jgi:VWFA-related protein
MGKGVLKSQVPLVVLDVVVTDGKGHPVRGLKASDFTVLEKGQKMTLQSFEEHRLDQTPPPAPLPTKRDLGPNIFTNITYTPNNGPLNILLMDALNTPMSDQGYVRQQMLEYLKKLPDGTRIAIFSLSTRLFILQGFTTDPAVLRAVLTRKKGLPSESPLLATPQDAEAQQDVISAMGNSPASAQMQADMQQFLAEINTSQTTMRMQYTLAAMNDLARYFSGLPGRKNLIWFSGSFPFNIMPDGDLENPFGAMADFAEDVKATADLLTRSQVAVYPVDARGLFTNEALSASVSGRRFVGNPRALEKSDTNFFRQTAAEHATMDAIAEQTGGKALYDANDLKGAVQEAINQGSNYYTLTYTPTNRKWDGSYRSVRVELDQSSVDLFYRHGYYADDPSAPPVHGQKALPMSAMQTAMLRGGPDPTQILFAVKIVCAAERENTLPPANRPNQKKMRPPYRHYTVWYVPDLRDISFAATSDGSYHGSLEFLTMLYSPDGELMNSTGTVLNANMPAAEYKELMERGLRLFQPIDAPDKGEYFLRLGIHDIKTDRVGAIEVPLAAIQPGLAPASPAPAPK